MAEANGIFWRDRTWSPSDCVESDAQMTVYADPHVSNRGSILINPKCKAKSFIVRSVAPVVQNWQVEIYAIAGLSHNHFSVKCIFYRDAEGGIFPIRVACLEMHGPVIRHTYLIELNGPIAAILDGARKAYYWIGAPLRLANNHERFSAECFPSILLPCQIDAVGGEEERQPRSSSLNDVFQFHEKGPRPADCKLAIQNGEGASRRAKSTVSPAGRTSSRTKVMNHRENDPRYCVCCEPMWVQRLSNKPSSRLLDGVTHDGMPEVRHA